MEEEREKMRQEIRDKVGGSEMGGGFTGRRSVGGDDDESEFEDRNYGELMGWRIDDRFYC